MSLPCVVTKDVAASASASLESVALVEVDCHVEDTPATYGEVLVVRS